MTQVNAIGDACPLPVVKTKKALSEMTSGSLEILVDNEIAVQNIKRLADSSGCRFEVKPDGDAFKILLEKPAAAPQTDAGCCDMAAAAGKTVVVLAADTMGSGDDELGQILMKGFIFALTQLDVLPDTILLYNAGAKLAVKGSRSLEDLVALEKAGVGIITCGTCLNHFGVADALGVGEVGNMYGIVEELRTAGRILRP